MVKGRIRRIKDKYYRKMGKIRKYSYEDDDSYSEGVRRMEVIRLGEEKREKNRVKREMLEIKLKYSGNRLNNKV